MIKRLELTDPTSCMSRAADDEPTFVLLGRDLAAPWTIRAWCSARILAGKNAEGDPQIAEARACADAMDVYRQRRDDDVQASAVEAAAPRRCPRTGAKFFATIRHPARGWVPTYGGPHDSYTIPERSADGAWVRERFDHDEGAWVEGDEVVGDEVSP